MVYILRPFDNAYNIVGTAIRLQNSRSILRFSYPQGSLSWFIKAKNRNKKAPFQDFSKILEKCLVRHF